MPGRIIRALAALLLLALASPGMASDQRLKIAVAGLTHTHVHWLLGRDDRGDIEIVGIAEPDRDLARRYTRQYGLSMDLVYDTLEELLDAREADAVTAFGSIYDHLAVVETAAPRGIHVMVEKPLAVNLEHAAKMQSLAEEHGIELLTNYETTWYGSTHAAAAYLSDGELGPVRKLVFHHGHEGPVKIGVNAEFLDWLIDPVQNGGGAIIDFGCYGVNLATWLQRGARPVAVTAITQTLQPALYANVDDEATIIIEYAESQAIVQASWNWPVSRKDMELYGETGYVIAEDRERLRVQGSGTVAERREQAPPRTAPLDDPFAYFRAVIRGETVPAPYALSSLENNMLVVEILDAARRSAATGQRVEF